ncbi:MAG: 2-oxoisovalerate dehydrogenase, partial [Candidatus Acidiferrales bacterium]
MTETEIIFAIEESPEGGFEARALGHAIFTQADTIDELKVMLRDAVECHFDGAAKPRVIRLHWTKDEVI